MPRKRVWVLGSGFSRPLGGPLLNELLTSAASKTMGLRYGCEFGHVVERYRRGLERGVWFDAEVFLETLDLALRSAISRDEGDRHSTAAAKMAHSGGAWDSEDLRNPQKFVELRDAAYRLIAIQCHEFVEQSFLESERWRPYCDWASRVRDDEDQTVLTFNYDCVLEKLGFHVVPSPAKKNASAHVLKLHGSIGWTRKQNGDAEWYEGHASDDDTAFLTKCNPPQIGIAVPGETKRERVGGPLKELWEAGTKAISEADEIFFVGYRFPPSDSQALMSVVDAIESNRLEMVQFHIVLGQDLRHPDVARLKGILEFAQRNRGNTMRNLQQSSSGMIHEHPLFAQDFLALWRG